MSSFELVGIQTRILLKSEINSANAVGVNGLDSSKSRVKVQQPHCSDSTVQHNRLIHADLGHSFCMPPRPASRRTLARFLSNVSSWDCHKLWLVSCVLLNKERASLLAFWLDVFRCLEMSTEISRDVLNYLELSWIVLSPQPGPRFAGKSVMQFLGVSRELHAFAMPLLFLA
jgi:hypothetical protein